MRIAHVTEALSSGAPLFKQAEQNTEYHKKLSIYSDASLSGI